MELNIIKIKRLKKAMGLTWLEIAKRGGLKSRQHAFSKFSRGSIKSAEFFGRVFKIKPKDLIK